ncbi:MAG: MtnX-like HAD-IB family phosphatase [candidate division Zixibacteria bacterium]|nr:MtnX-like HAD-IB family phosphatase [candidate division Zixibacteria bacterium]
MKSNGTNHNLVVFSDFDGTISTQDVGNRLFHHFSQGKSEETVGKWQRNEIDSRQCLIGEAASMRPFTADELFEFIDSFEIDTSFHEFLSLIRRNDIPLYLLSDGLDLYINRILANNNINGIPVFANKAIVTPDGFKFEFPYFEHSCGSCANCKGYHIKTLCPEGHTSIYIGDGKSDLCALPEADIIFAKDYLANYCHEKKIEFLPFDNFSGITKLLTEQFPNLI